MCLQLNISEETIKKEFNRIKQGVENGYKTNYSWNETVLYFQWQEFYKKELQLWQENKMYRGLPLRSWIYLNRKKYIGKGYGELTDREILRAFKISGVHIGNSFHSPFYIKQFINDYKVSSVYDPCGGFGHRLLGAYNIQYIYNDINSAVYENVQRMSDYFHLTDKYFYNHDAARFSPDEDYEAVFTCPPYGNTEIYSDAGAENLSKSDFLLWWADVLNCSLKPVTKYFAYIINTAYLEPTQSVVSNFGLKLKNIIPLGKNKMLNHFQRNTNNVEKGEFLLIFS